MFYLCDMMTCLNLAGIAAQLTFWPLVALSIFLEMQGKGVRFSRAIRHLFVGKSGSWKRAIWVLGPSLAVFIVVLEFAPSGFCTV